MSGVLRCQRGQEFWVFDTIRLCASGSFGCSRGPCTGGIGTPQQDATARTARLLRSQCQTARGIFKCCCALQERMLPKRLKVSYKALLSMFRSRLRTWLQVISLFFVSFCSAGEYSNIHSAQLPAKTLPRPPGSAALFPVSFFYQHELPEAMAFAKARVALGPHDAAGTALWKGFSNLRCCVAQTILALMLE